MVDMVNSCAVCAWWLMMWGHWRGATMGRLKIASNSFDPGCPHFAPDAAAVERPTEGRSTPRKTKVFCAPQAGSPFFQKSAAFFASAEAYNEWRVLCFLQPA